MLKTLSAYIGEYKKDSIKTPIYIIFEVLMEIPISFCCSTKYLPESSLNLEVTYNIIITITTDTIVSGISSTIILTNVETRVIVELIT